MRKIFILLTMMIVCSSCSEDNSRSILDIQDSNNTATTRYNVGNTDLITDEHDSLSIIKRNNEIKNKLSYLQITYNHYHNFNDAPESGEYVFTLTNLSEYTMYSDFKIELILFSNKHNEILRKTFRILTSIMPNETYKGDIIVEKLPNGRANHYVMNIIDCEIDLQWLKVKGKFIPKMK